MKINYTIFQQVKNTEYPSYTEDFFACSINKNVELGKNFVTEGDICFALCDGASESFDSKSWARLLSSEFCMGNEVFFQSPQNTQRKEILLAKLAACCHNYVAAHNGKELSWAQQQAFERGSFSSLLTCFITKNTAHFLAIGDTTGFILNRNAKKTFRSFSYQHAEQFSQNPLLLSTNHPAQNAFLHKNNFINEHCQSWQLSSQTTVLLMTDALACWTLQNKEQNSTENLLTIKDNDEFCRFILELRQKGLIKTDDTTLIKISIQ